MISTITDQQLIDSYSRYKNKVHTYREAGMRDHELEKKLRYYQAEMLRRKLPLS